MPTRFSRRPLRIQPLEDRGLLTAFIDAGTLTVTGTSRNDLIQIAPSGSDLLVRVNQQTMQFAATDVSSLYIDGRAGNDRIYLNGAITLDATIHGGPGNDRIVSGAGNDTLFGEQGNDRINGGGGNDSIWAGVGNDFVSGDDGNDVIHGDAGNDGLQGKVGKDQLYGDAGNDRLRGDEDGDYLYGGAGRDLLHGDAGDDRLNGQAGIDALFGDDGYDWLVNDHDGDKLRAGPINHGYSPPILMFPEGPPSPSFKLPDAITG